MLSYMRRNAGSWMIKALLFGVALSFIIGFGVLPTLRDEKGQGVVVAQVGDRIITRGEWDQAYENLLGVYRRVYQDRLSDEMVQQLRLRETALDNLINRILQLQEADRLGLEVSDEALRARIRSLPYFQRNGDFAKDLYVRVLQLNRLNPGDFEKQQREEILVEAFQAFLRGSVKVSEQELWNTYQVEKEQVSLKAIALDPSDFEGAVEVDEKALKTTYEQNGAEFMTPERVKAAYVLVAPGPYRDEVKVYTGDIEEYYDSHIQEFSLPEELRLRHILLRVPVGADPSVREEKRKILEGLADRIRDGEDFGELAKTFSEDPSSKEQGGDLGYVKRGKLVPEVERAAFSLKPGEVSDVVASNYGLHLLKVEDYRASTVEPLEEVKERIRETLTDEKAWRLARRKAEEFSWDVKEKGAFPEVGSSVGDLTVKETGFFSRIGEVPGMEQEESFRRAAFSLEPGQMSEVIKGEKGYYILEVLEKKAPEIPPFEQVRDQVEKRLRGEESRELARKRAEEMLAAARTGASFDELAGGQGYKPFETGFFSRLRAYVPRIGASEELVESAFGLTEANPLPDRVFEVNGRFYVIRLKEREEPTREAFLAEKQDLQKRQEQEKAQEVYRDWLAELRRQKDVKIMALGT